MAFTHQQTQRISATGRRIPRYHKECTLGAGRRQRRSKQHLQRWESAVLHHRRRRHLTPDQFRALMTLPSWLNRGNGRCDPAHQTIAARADVCVRTVQRAFAIAKRFGLIGWDQRAARVGDETVQITNQYVLFPGLAEPADAPAIEAPPRPEQRSTEDIKSISGCSDSLSPLERALAALGRAIEKKVAKTIQN